MLKKKKSEKSNSKKVAKTPKIKINKSKKEISIKEISIPKEIDEKELDRQILEKEKEISRLESISPVPEIQEHSLPPPVREFPRANQIQQPPRVATTPTPDTEIVYNVERNYTTLRPANNPNNQNEVVYQSRNYISPLDTQRRVAQSTFTPIQVPLLERPRRDIFQNPTIDDINKLNIPQMNLPTGNDQERAYKASDFMNDNRRRRRW